MKFSGKVGNGSVNIPYRDTGKMCLGGGMHCPSASSLIIRSLSRLGFNACHAVAYL